MCGISVIIDQRKSIVDKELITKMNNVIKHRGPDGEGFYFGNHIAIGHRMLKITDFSIEGTQPMSFYNYTITYNGEIYNFKEIKELLIKDNYEFKTQTDTEVILGAYHKWGQHCIEHFTGMWAFAIYDPKKNIVFCSRDRFGIKPFCYTQIKSQFVIASEIKQFTVFNEFKPILNQKTAFNFLYNNAIDNTQDTFFEDINFLPPGHNLIYNLQNHSYAVNSWYTLQNKPTRKKTSFSDAVNTFKNFFTQSVLSHMQTKLPVGSCLSGGLDSTSIVGTAKKTDHKLATFSCCYVQHGYNEIEYIDTAIAQYNFESNKVYPNIHELIEKKLLNKIVYHQDQPISSGSFFSEYKVFETATNKNIKIMLSGQGADEYLGGYREFSLLNLRNLFRRGKLKSLYKEIKGKTILEHKSIKDVIKDFIIFGLRLPYFVNKINKINSIDDCFNKNWLTKLDCTTPPQSSFSKYKSVSDLSKAAITHYSLPHQLHSEDRNAMLHSIESRLPFLDHKLIEWCLTLPDTHIISKGVTKAILRKAMQDVLPADIYNRQTKLGFPGPEESLFTHHHYAFIQKEFKDVTRLFPSIFSEGLLKMHNAYCKNQIPYNNIMFRALAFTAWAKEFGISEHNTKNIKYATEHHMQKVKIKNVI